VARQQSIEIRKLLGSVISKARLEELAKQSGAWTRCRKISASGFFWSLMLGFSVGNHRTIAGLRRSFQKSVGRTVVPSAFYDRFNPKTVDFLKAVLAEMITGLQSNLASLKGSLAVFRDILITDSTLIRLHDLLEKTFPSVWTNYMKASMKAHVVLSVKAGGMNSVKITPGSFHDGPRLRVGPWAKGKLLIFDLGYYWAELFKSIEEQDGYFLSRLKQSSNPRVIDGTSKGCKLKSYLEQFNGTHPIDVEVEFYYYHRPQKQRPGKWKFFRARVVGVFNAESKKYHLYVTNIPKTALNAEQIGRLYTARWLIELLFRELKSNFRMDQIPSKKQHVVEALVYAAFIALLISRAFLEKLRRSTTCQNRIPQERWAAIWTLMAPDLLGLVLRPYHDRRAEKYLMTMIQREAFDPNRSRKLLLDRAFQ
jgi:putative transposase